MCETYDLKKKHIGTHISTECNVIAECSQSNTKYQIPAHELSLVALLGIIGD